MSESGCSVRRFLWLSVPIAFLAMFASVKGLLCDAAYAQETPYWAAQAVGQDFANLVAYPALLILGLAAARGSLKAYFAQLEIVVYSTYSYALYAGYVHFSPLFPVYVAVLGLSLPAMIITAVLLARRRGLGHCMSAPLLAHLGILGLAILAMIVSMAARDLPVPWAVPAIFASTTVISIGLLLHFLTGVRVEGSLFAVLRGRDGTDKGWDDRAATTSKQPASSHRVVWTNLP